MSVIDILLLTAGGFAAGVLVTVVFIGFRKSDNPFHPDNDCT